MHPRMKRERKTVATMIGIYCSSNHHHDQDGLCPACSELLEYANLRLAHCPYQEGKTTCGNCPNHCYKPSMKEKIREVMRTAGPKMWRHPLLALGHMIDGLRKKPTLKKKS